MRKADELVGCGLRAPAANASGRLFVALCVVIGAWMPWLGSGEGREGRELMATGMVHAAIHCGDVVIRRYPPLSAVPGLGGGLAVP